MLDAQQRTRSPPGSWMPTGTHWVLPQVPSVPRSWMSPHILNATRFQMLNRYWIRLWALDIPGSLTPPVPGSPLHTPHCLLARCPQGASWPWYAVTLSFPWQADVSSERAVRTEDGASLARVSHPRVYPNRSPPPDNCASLRVPVQLCHPL